MSKVVKLDAEGLKALVESVAKEAKKPVAKLTVEGLRKIIREEAEAMMGEASGDYNAALDKAAADLAVEFEDRVQPFQKGRKLVDVFHTAVRMMANEMERLAHYGPGKGYDVDRQARSTARDLVGAPEDVQAAVEAVKLAAGFLPPHPMAGVDPDTVYPPGRKYRGD